MTDNAVIKKILKIQNIGLFQNVTEPLELGKVTGIYAENGKGKSTLAAILRSSVTTEASILASRHTIDAQDKPQYVDILWGAGRRRKFESGAWTESSPVVSIFDSIFIEQNVYSGFAIRADQRQSLLDFALGEEAVTAKRKIDQLTEEIRVVNNLLLTMNRELAAHATPMIPEKFFELEQVEGIPEKLAKLEADLSAAKSSTALQAKLEPEPILVPTASIERFKMILEIEFQVVAESAEQIVKDHLQKHPAAGIRNWVENGLQYTTEECPFCGQNLDSIELISAYKQAFSSEYNAAKAIVQSLPNVAENMLGNFKYELIQAKIQINDERCKSWQSELEFSTPNFAEQEFRSAFEKASELADKIVALKLASPLDRLECTAEIQEIQVLIDSAMKAVADYNKLIVEIIAKIKSFKSSLEISNQTVLSSEIERLKSVEKRYKSEVVDLINKIKDATTNKESMNTEKEAARLTAGSLMESTLNAYQSKINALLVKFGASFGIEKLKPNYTGGTPRSDFGITIRGRSVPLTSSSTAPRGPSFETTLSEADKRTLAFAFFLAHLADDPKLADTVVVLDDPMSSMDLARRHETIRQSCTLASTCAQLIILSHDPYFLRKFSKELGKHFVSTPMKSAKIHRGIGNYSIFSAVDLDQECASEYVRHHNMVRDFVQGNHSGNSRDVAKAIRPMLEGYLHRRFPGLIDAGQLFGEIIRRSTDDSTSPLFNLSLHITEYNAVNSYAGDFHHATNPSADSIPVIDDELRSYAQRALNLIYQNG